MMIGWLLAACSLVACGSGNNDEKTVQTNTITISQLDVTINGDGGSATVTIKTNHEWGAISSEKWLTISPNKSTQTSIEATISASANATAEAREGHITIMAGTARKTINVKQNSGKIDPNGPQAPEGYKLVWNDEFNTGSKLNPDHWTHEVQGSGWVNNELQTYVNGEHNGRCVTEIKDGTLRITAFKEGANVYSGRVYANVNKGWRYGIFEAKIKLPKGRGTWPAFWMMPANNDFKTMPWPRCGEIDIMEEVGYNPNYTSSSFHSEAYNHVKGTQKTAERLTANAEGNFHIYRLEWTPDYMQTYVDGEPLLRFENDGANNISTWPYNKPFYLILNLAWGGAWGGQKGVDETALPATMEVDYVRVYQKK